MIKLAVISAVLLISALCTGAAAVKPLYVDPACPKPGEAITLRAAPAPSQVPIGPIAVSSNGSTFTLVLPTEENGFDVPVGSVSADIGPLPLGTYTVQFYVQPSGALGPEELVATTTFVVQDNPPVCEARYVVPLTYAAVTGLILQPYSSALSVQVVDAHDSLCRAWASIGSR
jgi:hypothetical protein